MRMNPGEISDQDSEYYGVRHRIKVVEDSPLFS